MTHRPGPRRGGAAVVGALVLVASALGGCTSPSTGAAGTHPPGAGTIGLLLPEASSARYETTDRPTFTDVVGRRCAACDVLYANADQDAALQLEQAESMLARGADVLVLDAVDSVSAASIVREADRLGVPVIAYDRMVDGAAYYVSFDSELIGYLEGTAVLGAVEAQPRADGLRPGLLLVQGSPTDPNSAAFARGVHRALAGADVDVLAEYYTPDGSPDQATDWVEGQLTTLGHRVDGVVAANDAMAGGAVAALKSSGFETVPPTAGQDGELAAIQRIISGDQFMTVYKATSQQARTAAELAVRVLRGERPVTTATIEGTPSLVLSPRAVAADDVERVMVEGGVYTTAQICTRPYADACRAAGLLDGDR